MALEISPGQLYTTASGHLYHAGKICIVMVGLPARGKTHRAVSIARYLRWLGVKGQAFHLGDYRRKITHFEQLPEDWFDPSGTSQYAALRAQIIEACFTDMWAFYSAGGQVALYDAINATAESRRNIAVRCRDHNVECLFVESLVTDENMLARNIGDLHAGSPDYRGRDPNESVAHFLKKLENRLAHYEPMFEPELPFIKVMNDGDKCMVNHGHLGYLLNRVLLFLLNSRRVRGSFFFARAGATGNSNETFRDDDELSPGGQQYAQTLTNTILGYISARAMDPSEAHLDLKQVRRFADHTAFGSAAGSAVNSSAASAVPSRSNSAAATPTEPPLIVWTSTRNKTVQTSAPLREAGYPVSHKSLLNSRNPGSAATLTEAQLKESDPAEYAAFLKDPYHHRYPRGESYQDVAIRMEPLLMEMERIESSLLIIAHESVLRVLYGYLMGSSVEVIPSLQFPANQVVELIPSGYSYSAKSIPLARVTPEGSVEPR